MANEKTIGTGKDYSTVASWEAYMDGLLNSDDQTGKITGLTEDNGTIYIDGITGSSYICRIEADTGQAADGTDAKGAQLDETLISAESSDEVHLEIDGLEFHTTNMGISSTFDHADSTVVVTRCVFRDLTVNGITIQSCGANSHYIGVCLFRNMSGSGDSGIKLFDTDVTDCKVFNCSFYDNDEGVRELQGTFADFRNNVALSNADDFLGTPSNMSYCCSSDTSATGTGSLTSKTAANNWTDAASNDFTIVDTDADIYHAGETISGESWFPGTDLVGTTWDASNPSMGCFELAAAGGYSITIDTASYSLTGSDVNLIKGSTLSIEAGSYALTGSDVDILKGSYLGIESGSYVLTGSDIILVVARTLGIEAGSYLLTGSDVGLLRGYPLVIDGGSYILTGSDLDLMVSKLIGVESGSYTLTGSDIDLVYSAGYTLVIDTGSYILTGQDIGLVKGYLIGQEAGSYVLTGSDLDLVRGLSLDVEGGSYLLTGSDLDLVLGYKINIELGSYLLTGFPVTLDWSGAVAASPGRWMNFKQALT